MSPSVLVVHSARVPQSASERLPNHKHLIIIANPSNVVISRDGTVTMNLGTKAEAIKALHYAIELLER